MERLADGDGDAVDYNGGQDEEIVDGDQDGAEVFCAGGRGGEGVEGYLGVKDCSDACDRQHDFRSRHGDRLLASLARMCDTSKRAL